MGEAVLSGGELPALFLIDAVCRWLPGVLGNEASAQADSFATGLLDHPHYTRPAEFEGLEAPGRPAGRRPRGGPALAPAGGHGADPARCARDLWRAFLAQRLEACPGPTSGAPGRRSIPRTADRARAEGLEGLETRFLFGQFR